MTQKTPSIKKYTYMNWTSSSLPAKDTVKRTQRQVIDWENTPANHIPDKQLVKIYKDLSKSKIKNIPKIL